MQKAELELLVLAFQERDKRALGLLYKHYTPRLHHYAMARVGQRALADDLVQNVWLRIHKGIAQLRDAQVFESWLYRLLRWQIMDWSKSKQRQEVSEDDALPMLYFDADPEQLGVFALLPKLEPMEREVIELHYLHDFELRSIALVLDVPEGTVKSRLHRARKQLKEAYLAEQES